LKRLQPAKLQPQKTIITASVLYFGEHGEFCLVAAAMENHSTRPQPRGPSLQLGAETTATPMDVPAHLFTKATDEPDHVPQTGTFERINRPYTTTNHKNFFHRE
jgi:hypothetical protein